MLFVDLFFLNMSCHLSVFSFSIAFSPKLNEISFYQNYVQINLTVGLPL